MSKAKSKPRKPSKMSIAKVAKPKLKMREIQPAQVGGKGRVTPKIAREAVLKVMELRKSRGGV